MGKGTIISHIAAGQYNVTVNYDTSAIDARITILSDRQTLLEGELSTEQAKATPDAIRVRLLKLQILSVEKQIEYLQNTSKVPDDFTTTAWCADLTTDLTGEVGLVEVGREKENGLNIQPGYDSNATFTEDRDGQLVPLMAQTPAATFYNLAMLPGFQKWKPIFRYGTITAIDYDLDTCSVTLDAITSSQQNLNINQSDTLTDVPIEYMDCNSTAFEISDDVVVSFTGYDWDYPKVIGFKDHPQPCSCFEETYYGPSVTTNYGWSFSYTAGANSTCGLINIADASQVASELAIRPSGPNNAMRLYMPAQASAGVRQNFLTLGTYDDTDSIIRANATRTRVICTDLLAECLDWHDLSQYIGSRVGVLFQGNDGTNFYNFYTFFHSVTPIGPAVNGVDCLDGNYLTSYTNTYYYQLGSPARYYSAYLNYGASNAAWLNLPVTCNINYIQIFMILVPITTAYIDHADYHNATESRAVIDSIEIC